MKNFRKILSTVLAVMMVLSLCTVFASADDEVVSDLAANWDCYSAKYSSKTDKVIPRSINSELFKYDEQEDGSVKVDMPIPTEKDENGDPIPGALAGVYSVTLMESKYQTVLDDLTVTFKPDNFDFTTDGVGMVRDYSVVFTEEHLTEITNGDKDNPTGIYWGNAVYTNGLRHILPEGSKGLCVNISGNAGSYWATNRDPMVACQVMIVYFNGKDLNPGDNRPGSRWTFYAKGCEEGTFGQDEFGRVIHFPKIYTGEGVTVSFKPDTTHGYVVTINGKEYYDEMEIGFFPEISGKSPRTAADLGKGTYDVDLSELVGVKGYLGVGATSNADDINTNADYTVVSINGIPAAKWAGEANTHEHVAGEAIEALPATCTGFGSTQVICTECGAVISDTIVDPVSPTGEHTWGDWETTVAATYFAPGAMSRTCTTCGEEQTVEVAQLKIPFIDLPLGTWFTPACLWCYDAGYMTGTSSTTFSPDMKLTRAQFVQILAKVEGVDLNTVEFKDNFTDVPAGQWYSKAVTWAVEFGVTGGMGNGIFAPNVEVSRQQLATFMRTYAQKKNVDVTKKADLSKYADEADIAKWAVDAVAWAVEVGLISGTDATHVSPATVATRAQVAVIIKNFVEKVLPTAEEPVEEPETPDEPVEEPEQPEEPVENPDEPVETPDESDETPVED